MSGTTHYSSSGGLRCSKCGRSDLSSVTYIDGVPLRFECLPPVRTGYYHVVNPLPIVRHCPMCSGTGKTEHEPPDCPFCAGTGHVVSEPEVTFTMTTTGGE